MNYDFLPISIREIVSKLNGEQLYEIRLRIGQPIMCKYGGKYCCLSKNGLTILDDFIVCSKEDIDYVVSYFTKDSLYAYNDNIKKERFYLCLKKQK